MSNKQLDKLVKDIRVNGVKEPLTEWPLAVYICLLSEEANEPESDAIASEKLSILDWGEIRQTP